MSYSFIPNTIRYASNGYIRDLEEKIPSKLPKEYVSFLVKRGVGILDGSYDIQGTDLEIHNFLTFPENQRDTLSLDFYIGAFSNRVPSDCIPIAYDSGGNVFCIGLKGENRGAVYYCDREFEYDEEDETEETRAQKFTKVSNSFSDFLSRLEKYTV
ncbi:SMI1/KNR4 family protein [Profundibacter sp.]